MEYPGHLPALAGQFSVSLFIFVFKVFKRTVINGSILIEIRGTRPPPAPSAQYASSISYVKDKGYCETKRGPWSPASTGCGKMHNSLSAL